MYLLSPIHRPALSLPYLVPYTRPFLLVSLPVPPSLAPAGTDHNQRTSVLDRMKLGRELPARSNMNTPSMLSSNARGTTQWPIPIPLSIIFLVTVPRHLESLLLVCPFFVLIPVLSPLARLKVGLRLSASLENVCKTLLLSICTFGLLNILRPYLLLWHRCPIPGVMLVMDASLLPEIRRR